MSTVVDIAAAVVSVLVLGLLRVVWRLSERVARLEGRSDTDGVTKRRRL